MMSPIEKAKIRLDSLKNKLPKENLNIAVGMTSWAQVHVKFSSKGPFLYDRDEYFSEVSVEDMELLLSSLFPEVYRAARMIDAEFEVRKNGVHYAPAMSLEQAEEIIYYALLGPLSLEDLYTVKDSIGQITARFVSNLDGTMRKLD